MIKNRNKIILISIIILAFFLRFYQISSTAPLLNWDEAALGYNAYTLGLDGSDEFGNKYPLTHLVSFGDYKPVVYSYLAIVPVKIFGLNELGVRIPSIVFGVLTVLLTYFLTKELFPKLKRKEGLALTATFILAVSPWHIMLSRGAYEANIASFLIVFGALAFLKAINKNIWYLVPSAVFFTLTLYTFNTSRIFVPLFVITLAFIFRKKLLKNYKATIVAAVVGLILVLPILPFILSDEAKLRYAEVNIFSDLSIIERSNQYTVNDGNKPWSRLIHNRRVLYALEYADHYLDHFNPTYLFISGDRNPRFSTQDVGQLYLIYLPLLIIGTIYLFRRKDGYYYIIPIWILLGIIPAATARETPHALRTETIVPMLQIIVAYGLFVLLDYIKKERYKKLFFSGFIFLVFMSLVYFFHGLIFHYPREYSEEWQYPYKEAVGFVEMEKDNYDKVYFTTDLGRPYIYFLIYGESNDPIRLRNNSDIEVESYGFIHVNRLENIHFARNINDITPVGDTLYISKYDKVPENVNIIKKFNLLNGMTSLVAYEKK